MTNLSQTHRCRSPVNLIQIVEECLHDVAPLGIALADGHVDLGKAQGDRRVQLPTGSQSFDQLDLFAKLQQRVHLGVTRLGRIEEEQESFRIQLADANRVVETHVQADPAREVEHVDDNVGPPERKPVAIAEPKDQRFGQILLPRRTHAHSSLQDVVHEYIKLRRTARLDSFKMNPFRRFPLIELLIDHRHPVSLSRTGDTQGWKADFDPILVLRAKRKIAFLVRIFVQDVRATQLIQIRPHAGGGSQRCGFNDQLSNGQAARTRCGNSLVPRIDGPLKCHPAQQHKTE